MPVYEELFFCNECDGVMDIWADHALTCACGGDRTNATTWSAMLAFAWQVQQVGGQSPKNQVCCDLDQSRVAGAKTAVKEGKMVGDLRPVVQQIFMFHAGTVAVLPP